MKKKRNLTIVTFNNFLDHAFPIMPELNSKFNLFWIVIFGKIKSNNGFTNKDVIDFCQENNISIKCYNIDKRFRNPLTLITYNSICKFIKKTNFDYLYIDGVGFPYLIFPILLHIKRKKTIWAIHDFIMHVNFEYSFYLNIYQKVLINLFPNFHLLSQNQKNEFLKIYPNKNVLYAPLPLIGFGNVNTSIPAKENKIINFLFFGTIRPNKGLEYLILAANLAAKKNQDFKITIAGSCPDNWEYYDSLIENRSIFDIKNYSIPNEEISILFNNSDYLVLPYKDFTQSGPLMIALYYNLPVIASDHLGSREIIKHEENGFLFESGNVDDLCNTLLKLTNLDKNIYNELKNNLNKYASDNFNISNIANLYIDFFK